jgi:hypothetical protein
VIQMDWDKQWERIKKIAAVCGLWCNAKTIVCSVAAALMALWSYHANQSAPLIVISSFFFFVVLIWAWNGITWRTSQRLSVGRENVLTQLDGSTDEQKVLIGSWFVTSASGDYIGSWVFRPDRTVITRACSKESGVWLLQEATGKWEMCDDRIRIVWSGAEHCWDSLVRPIGYVEVRGDSWMFKDRWRARKIVMV